MIFDSKNPDIKILVNQLTNTIIRTQSHLSLKEKLEIVNEDLKLVCNSISTKLLPIYIGNYHILCPKHGIKTLVSRMCSSCYNTGYYRKQKRKKKLDKVYKGHINSH